MKKIALIDIMGGLGNQLHQISMAKYLENLGPTQVLNRWYSIAMDKKTNKIIRSSKMIKKGDRFYLRTNKGSFEAEKLSNVKI